MTDLTARLREVIEERLRVAREATPGPWAAKTGYPQMVVSVAWPPPFDSEHQEAWLITTTLARKPDADAEFIALNDPADAILAGEHALGLLERHAVREFGPSGAFGALCEACSITEGEPVLRFIAWPCEEIEALRIRLGVSGD